MARWLEYETRDTFLHKGLHPLSKIVAIMAVMIISGFWWDPRYLILLLIPALIFVYVSKIPLYWFSVVLLAVVTSLYPVSITALGQTNPGIYKVLDPAWATTPILTYKFPIAGVLGITPGGLMWLGAVELRTVIMATYVFVFIYTTSLAQVTDTLLAFHVPSPVVFVIAIVYRLIPDLSRVVDNILSAQRLRGWNLMHWNPVKIVRRAIPLMNPLMRRVAILVEQITLATQIRGFGTGRPTATRTIELNRADYVVIAISTAFFLVACYLLIAFRAGLI
jgi:energy-coupling factor transporter transmembrane protein EcfT